MEGQQPRGLCLLRHGVFHVGVNDEDFLHLPAVVEIEKRTADLAGTLHGRVLRSVEKAALNRDLMVRKILPSILADDKELRVGVLVQKPLRLAQHVLIIHTGQTLIRRDNEIRIGSAERVIVTGVKIPALHAFHCAENPFDLAAQRVKIGPRPVEFRASFPQLG